MKLIIAGSRDCQASIEEIQILIDHYQLNVTAVVSGKARGMDTCGEKWANSRGIPILPFPVTKEEWDTIGKSAGHRRNAKMAKEGDALLLIWDGKSSGSAGMKDLMVSAKKPVYEGIVETVKMPIGKKVEYVKSQTQTRNHHCHWPGCEKQVKPAVWGCTEHWYKLPQKLRNKIWATFKPGQEVKGTPSRDYILAAREVQDWIEANK